MVVSANVQEIYNMNLWIQGCSLRKIVGTEKESCCRFIKEATFSGFHKEDLQVGGYPQPEFAIMRKLESCCGKPYD